MTNKTAKELGEEANAAIEKATQSPEYLAAHPPPSLAEAAPRPVYPDDAWAGTLFGDFAEIVCRDTAIPKKFSVESLRVLTGAIVGNQVLCGMAGVVMREYLVVIGLPQSGKSYGKDLAVMFYTQQAPPFLFSPLLFHGDENEYRGVGIGAQQFLPGSANSFADDLNRKPSKVDKKIAESAAEGGIVVKLAMGDQWKPYPRFITIQGEAVALISRFGNDWTGQALAAAIVDLYDGDEAEVSVTSERASVKKPVRVQYSMMLFTQPGTWRKYMAETVTESGLFGRFYIVGSEQQPAHVPLPDYLHNPALFQEHFGELRGEMFRRIHALANTELVMTVAPEARKKIAEWLGSIATGQDAVDRTSRMALHVFRACLARTWAARPQRTVITAEDADAGILLGEYQIKMREFYWPVGGDDRRSVALNRVRSAVRTKGRITLRDLKRQLRAENFSEQFEWSLHWLQEHDEIVLIKEGRQKITVAWVNPETQMPVGA